jgi:hypothetical protein
VNPIVGLLVSNRWDTDIGEIGVLVDVSYRKQYYNQPASFSDPRYEQNISGNNFLVSNAVGGFYTRGHRERPQANFALQWKPSPNVEIYVDGMYAHYKEQREIDYYFGVPGSASSVSNLQLYSPSQAGGCENIPASGTVAAHQSCELASGTFNNPYVATSTQAFRQSSHDAQIATGAKITSGNLKLTTDVAYTDSAFNENIFIIDTSLPNQTFDLTSNTGGHINWNLRGNDKMNPNLFQLQGLFQTGDSNYGNSIAWRTDATYDIDHGFLKKIAGGFRYVNRNAGATGQTQISTPIRRMARRWCRPPASLARTSSKRCPTIWALPESAPPSRPTSTICSTIRGRSARPMACRRVMPRRIPRASTAPWRTALPATFRRATASISATLPSTVRLACAWCRTTARSTLSPPR